MKIFLSHAAVDAEISDEFCGLLANGLNITRKDVFCSSLPGQNVPGGFDFVNHISAKLAESQTVICLFSKNYLDSQFCLAELGACWIKKKRLIPIVIPPITFSHLKATLTLTKGYEINTENGLNSIGQDLCKRTNLAQWGSAANNFLSQINKLILLQSDPQRVDYLIHKKIKNKTELLTQNNIKLERKISELNEVIKELKKCKDKTEVQEVMLKSSNEQQQFKLLRDDAYSKLCKLPNDIVAEAIFYYFCKETFLLSEAVDDGCASELKEATKNQFLHIVDDSYILLNEEHPKIIIVIEAVSKLQEFLLYASEEFIKSRTDENQFPFRLDNKEFWGKFLRI